MATTSPPRRKAIPPATPAGQTQAGQALPAAAQPAKTPPTAPAGPARTSKKPTRRPATQPRVRPAAGPAKLAKPARAVEPATPGTPGTPVMPVMPVKPIKPIKPIKPVALPKAVAALKPGAPPRTAAPESVAKNAVAKKAVAKKAVANKAVAKPPVAPMAVAQQASAPPPAAKQGAGQKVMARKALAKNVVAQKAVPQKAGAQKVVAQKVVAKKRQAKPAVAAVDQPPVAAPVPVSAAAIAPPTPPLLPLLSVPPVPAAVPASALAPSGPAHSEITLTDGPRRWLVWRPGHACPPTLQAAAALRLDAHQHLASDDDSALPTLLRLAADAGHVLRVQDAVWPHLAAHRDARSRLAVLASAYPAGPASPGLHGLLRCALPAYQAEGALFAVVAGRALLADERGLGKGVMAMAAAALWQRHFGVRRILLLCAPGQQAAWQRAWARFADPASPLAAAQVMDGGLHQRQALWSGPAGVRILSPDALASDRAHAAHWAPDLVIVDEPQQLGLHESDWAGLQSPHALVLCGAPLAEQPVLMQAILAWLDTDRLGPLAALHELQAASAQGLALTEPDIERLTASLSRTMLQRDRADLADQLPPLVHSERLLVLAPGQREVHDQQLDVVQRLLAGWQQSGYFSDADQWRLAQALRALQQACHRADPAHADSALAEPTVQALQAQLADWAVTGPLQIAVLCASAADRAQLARRLAAAGQGGDAGDAGEAGPADHAGDAAEAADAGEASETADAADADEAGDGDQAGETGDGDQADNAGGGAPGLHLLLPDDALPAGLDAVLQAGVPWRTRRSPAGPRGTAVPGQQWVYLVAQDSLEAGLFNTLAGRMDVPRGLGGVGDSAGRQFLQGDRLADWLRAVAAAVQAALPGGA